MKTWRSRLLELLVWAAVAVGTALLLIWLSGELLPSNF
jgi:hypothetical protein